VSNGAPDEGENPAGDSHTGPVEYLRNSAKARLGAGLVFAGATVATAVEFATPASGLRVLVVGAAAAAPALLFLGFWRALGRLDELLSLRYRTDWRGRWILWAAFSVVWFADLVATVWFFFVPGLEELMPTTVLLYDLAGIPGVVVAAASYAGIVVAITRRLSEPTDVDFLLAMTLLYGVFVVHNYVLLLGG